MRQAILARRQPQHPPAHPLQRAAIPVLALSKVVPPAVAARRAHAPPRRRKAVQVRRLRPPVLTGAGPPQARVRPPRGAAIHLLRVQPPFRRTRRAAAALCTEPRRHQDILVRRLRQVIQLVAGSTPAPEEPPRHGDVKFSSREGNRTVCADKVTGIQSVHGLENKLVSIFIYAKLRIKCYKNR